MTQENLPARQEAKQGDLALYDYGNQAGAGFENQTSEDVAIPFLGVLQPLSPEVSGDPGARIRGAGPGMLYNTVTQELFNGESGVVIQPCDTNHVFVEWRPRAQGGGFVAIHDLDSDVVKQAKARSQQFGKYQTAAGNDLIETFYIAGLLHRHADLATQAQATPEPLIIAFTSTKIRVYKGIMTRLRTFGGQHRPPLFAHRLRIRTVSEKNAKGAYYNYAIEPLVDNDVAKSLVPSRLGEEVHPLLKVGHGLMEAYRSGAVRANHEKQQGGEGEANKDDIPF